MGFFCFRGHAALFFLLNRAQTENRVLRHAGLAAVFCAALTQVSCMSTADFAESVPPAGMSSTGQYPSLGAPLQAAAPQMSDAEAQGMAQKFKALENAHNAGALSEAEYEKKVAELKALGQATQDAAKSAN